MNKFEHIYIHWPFCASRCHYCDFIALAEHKEFYESYHQALCHEIELVTQTSNQKQQIKTIFLGGGTPSLYPTHMIEDVIKTLHTNFDLSHIEEFTIEANPADIDKQKLQAWKDLGINRLSMGVQILDDAILERLNRQQTTEQVLRAIELAPNYFQNISIDLILGLPDITEQVWQQTLQTVVQWPLKHISVYFLTIYEKTPLQFRINKGEFNMAQDDTLVQMYKYTINFLQEHKFLQYEISNFAKPVYESVHNTAYWDRKPYYGFGLGASSFDGLIRFTNHNNIESYIKSVIIDQKTPISSSESLNAHQIILETLMLSLRQTKGLGLHSVLYLLTDTQKTSFYKNIELLKNEALLQQDMERIHLTSNGIILENEVVLKLCQGVF